MLRVDLSPLDEGHHEFALRPTLDELDLDPEMFAEVTVDLRLDVMKNRVLAAFDVAAIATLECDRTLVHFQQPVRGEHSVVFVPQEQIGSDSVDDSLLPLPEVEQQIDLTQSVRETLLLAVPLRRVSPEAEDAEITTSFGDQQLIDGVPVDDRWDALRALRSGKSD